MNEGIGSAVVLTIIIIFIAVVSTYMAFNVNYTKAFRVKNKIVDNYNKYGIVCRDPSSDCYKEIISYAKELGYNPRKVLCPSVDASSNYYPVSNDYYCAVSHKKDADPDSIDDGEYYYFSITTTIDIDIPIVNNVLGIRLLTVTGDTKTIKVSDFDSGYLADFSEEDDSEEVVE